MPKVTLTMRKGRTAKEKQTLLDGVHNALVEAFGIPDNDRYQIIHEIEADNWDVPHNQNQIIIEVMAFAGRSIDAKRSLYGSIVRNLEKVGVTPEDVFIILNDIPMENWGIRGGKAACDIDFSFKIDV